MHHSCHEWFPVETMKVDKFVKSLQDPRLQTCKEIIAGDTKKLHNFTLTQQFVSTSLVNQKAQTTMTRKVSLVKQEDKKTSKNNKRNPKKGSTCKAEEANDMEELDPTKCYANRIYDAWPAAYHTVSSRIPGNQSYESPFGRFLKTS